MEGSSSGSLAVWQDREIRFDVEKKFLSIRPGEVIVDKVNYVEDTKGNDGVMGKLRVTNLRLIWISSVKVTVNLSIGLRCIANLRADNITSKLKGVTEAVRILARFRENQFEFIFTNVVSEPSKLYSVISSIHRAYSTSKMYREVKLRGAIMENKSLKLLPLEQIYNKVNGVMNLSSDQGVLGVLYITNIRVAWHANTNLSYSLSVPYIQMKTSSMKQSKFGYALVIATLKESGYVLGFRIDPHEKMQAVMHEINRLHMVFSHHPIFGVEVLKDTSDFNEAIEEPPQDMEKLQQLEEESNIVSSGDRVDKIAIYFAESNKASDREPVFNEDIGLAIERLPTGCSLQELWEVK